jgi:hypothetical protein
LFVYGRCKGRAFIDGVIIVYGDREAVGGKVFDNCLANTPCAAGDQNRTFSKQAGLVIVQHGKHFLIEILQSISCHFGRKIAAKNSGCNIHN